MIHQQDGKPDVPLPPQDQNFIPAFGLAPPQELLSAERHRVTLLTLDIGDSMPKQLHLYASKMLVVMEGCATVLRNTQATLLYEGSTCAIPACTGHHIVNSGKIPLRLLEIRSGVCVEDDDHAS